MRGRQHYVLFAQLFINGPRRPPRIAHSLHTALGGGLTSRTHLLVWPAVRFNLTTAETRACVRERLAGFLRWLGDDKLQNEIAIGQTNTGF